MDDEEISKIFESKVKTFTNNKLGINVKIPFSFQGHTYALQVGKKGGPKGPVSGPFYFEFVLANEFLIHLSDHELSSVDVDEGYSNLSFKKIAKLNKIIIPYNLENSEEEKVAELTFKTTDKDRVQSFILKISDMDMDMDMDTSLRLASQIVATFLDFLSFKAQLPLQVRHIDICSGKRNNLCRRYLTLPFTSVFSIEETDFTSAISIPISLMPSLRLFREAISSSKPHYRLLCFFRVWEGALRKVQSKNSEILKERGIVPSRPKRRIPEIEITREYFPELIGKKINTFMDFVRENYRIPIAHLTFDEFDRMVLDPAYTKSEHKISYVNSVLQIIIRQSMQDELELMKKNDLK